MNTSARLRTLACVAGIASAVSPATVYAQSAPLPEVVVTATRLPAGLSATPGAFVIDRQTIEARQLTFAAQALQGVPGLSVFSNGPFGVTSVRQRGVGADKTLVLVDGVPINDVSQPQGNFDFAGFSLGDIDRIEVLSGPQASLWGSDAIGGVISISTLEPKGAQASLDGGAFGTLHADIAAGRSSDQGALGLSASLLKSDGISAADSRNNYARLGLQALRNREADGIKAATFSAKGRYRLTPSAQIEASLRYTDSLTEIDGYPVAAGYVLADTTDVYKSQSWLGRALAKVDGGFGLRHEISFSAYHLDRGAVGPSGAYGYDSTRTIARWTVEKGDLTDGAAFKGGVERLDNRATLSTGERAGLDSAAVFAVGRVVAVQGLTLTLSGRYDGLEGAENVATGRLAAVVALGAGFSLEGSAGRGFKAPTISEIACDFCNAPAETLKPEYARGYDAGVSWRATDGRHFARLTAYEVRIRDEIAYRDLHYVNIARTRARGLELSAQAEIDAHFRLEGSLGLTDSIDAVSRLRQLRAPKVTGSAGLYWRSGPADVALTARAQSRQADSDLDGYSRIWRPGYVVADLAGGYALNDHIRLTARVENLTDESYQQAFGFAASGRAVYAGIKLAR